MMIIKKRTSKIYTNDISTSLLELGWSPHFQSYLDDFNGDKVFPGRLESYQKMKRELMYLSHRQHKSADRAEKENWKKVALKMKEIKKRRKL